MKESYLDIEVDLRKAEEASKADLIVKIPRPKKVKVVRETQQVSQEFIRQTSPSYEADVATINRSVFEAQEIDNVEEFIAKTVDWGDFDVEKLVNLLCYLSQAISGKELKAYQLPLQKRLFRSILLNDGETITSIMSRQSGKTESISCSVATLCIALPALAKSFPEQLGAFKQGFWVGVYAPTGEQAKTMYGRIKAAAKSENAVQVYEDPEINVSMDKHSCRWSNGSFVFMQSASPKSQTESKSYHLLVLEEAQDLDEFVVNKSLYPMLAWNNGSAVMIGTVSEKPCLFYETIKLNEAGDVNKTLELKNHFEVKWQEVVRHNPKYLVHINNMKKKHGEHSKYFQMAYNLKWMFEEGRAVSDLDLKKYCMAIKIGLTKYTDRPVVVGIDLARKTNGSVVTVGELLNQESIYEDGEVEKLVTVKVCDWLELENLPYPQQRPLMKDFISRYPNVVAICVDSTGVGDAIFGEMQEEWQFYCQMIPFIFSPKSKNYLMNIFYEFMWKNRLIIPSLDEVRGTDNWQRFYLQTVNLEKQTHNGHVYLAKSTKLNARDDFPDSLFLMLHAAKEAIKNNGQIEMADIHNLYSTSRDSARPKGFEDIREKVRSGNYGTNTLREQRYQKLIKGFL